MDAVLPAITLVIGFVLALGTEWLRDGAAVRRETKRRATEVQRDTLIELQEALMHLGRAATGFHASRKRRAEERETWPTADELHVHYEALAETRMPIVTLSSRIDDAALREAIEALRQQEDALTTAATPEAADTAATALTESLTTAIERCGRLIREHA